MDNHENTILRINDTVSGRQCAIRIENRDRNFSLGELLEKYLKHASAIELESQNRITPNSSTSLTAIQDYVYLSDDYGNLKGIYNGVAFEQNSERVSLDDVLGTVPMTINSKTFELINIDIDRIGVGYDRNWKGFNRRRWDLRKDEYIKFVTSIIEEEYGSYTAQSILGLNTSESKLKFLRALSKKIWSSDFENYSRFSGNYITYKSGDETIQAIMENSGGGICSEKVQALKFLTDHYGLKSEFLIAGPYVPNPVPEEKLRDLLVSFDFSFSKKYMRYWQHTALIYEVEDKSILVDATNGNIPFLFLMDTQCEELLRYKSKLSVPVRMAVIEEDFYYHRVSQDIPENLFFAMEGWIPFVDLIQVFDNELGLYLSNRFMVTAVLYKTNEAFNKLKTEYIKVCETEGLNCSVDMEWNLDSTLAKQFSESAHDVSRKILDSRDHIIARYNQCNGDGHQAGIVVIELNN
ncbi:MAG TPA: hypothetical protein DGN60_01985 [Chloroflexi bacterium]|nr:hypothetical protein [Chloroflexota bacterium]|tara:strand:+ start:124 stop:1518 length:1395 start_codon:yes stop_codon:yes gene_type:complete